jgi:lambda family phage portal protein
MGALATMRAWFTRQPPPAAAARAFQGARVDRLTAGWLATTQSINAELRGDLDRLRARCRELVNNNDTARRFRQMCQVNIVGPGGVRMQSRVEDGPGRPDDAARAAIEAAWQEWSRTADLGGRQSLRHMLETLVGQLPSDGEFLVRMIVGQAAGNRFAFALQPIDADRIDTAYNVPAAGTSNAVVMGVEVDQARRPVALHLFAGHPFDGVHGSRLRERVPIEQLLHCFRVERPGQVRGIPWMSPGVLALHHLGKFNLAALLAAENGANHYGFFRTPDGQEPFGQADGVKQITVSQPGVYDVLPAGVEFTPHESKYPDQAYGPFVKAQLQRIAAGWGVAYHSLANDLEGVNFSSIRAGVIEERDRWSADQEWLIESFLRPVFREWLRAALLAGAITFPTGARMPLARYDKFVRHDWQPRRWDWVDPRKDAEAAVLRVRAGLAAPQDLAAAQGLDFEDVLRSIAAAQRLAQQLGVTLPAYTETASAAAPAPNTEEP